MWVIHLLITKYISQAGFLSTDFFLSLMISVDFLLFKEGLNTNYVSEVSLFCSFYF